MRRRTRQLRDEVSTLRAQAKALQAWAEREYQRAREAERENMWLTGEVFRLQRELDYPEIPA